jgi:hypothetical protein
MTMPSKPMPVRQPDGPTSPIVPPGGSALQQTGFQQPGGMRRGPSADETSDYQIQLEPPGPQRIFRLESEAKLQERIRQESRERPTYERIIFPDEPIVGHGQHAARMFPHRDMLVEPNYVCYNRLYFEQKNSERFGWDLCFIQPFVSAGTFFFDVATLPYHFWTDPCRCYECSAGYCLPGDPVPLLLYPPELSLTGALAEAMTGAALFLIFP